jgi:hypothetical protein
MECVKSAEDDRSPRISVRRFRILHDGNNLYLESYRNKKQEARGKRERERGGGGRATETYTGRDVTTKRNGRIILDVIDGT